MAKYRSKKIIEATQFIYEGPCDGEQACLLAKKLGLSRHNSSMLWEKEFFGLGWKIVEYGDYIKHNAILGTHDYLYKRDEFEKQFIELK